METLPSKLSSAPGVRLGSTPCSAKSLPCREKKNNRTPGRQGAKTRKEQPRRVLCALSDFVRRLTDEMLLLLRTGFHIFSRPCRGMARTAMARRSATGILPVKGYGRGKPRPTNSFAGG
jgi:hypothetical protein